MSEAARTGGRPGAAGAARPLLVAVEVDGLLQRFGRAVPDGAALLERITELKERKGGDGLEVVLVRLGSGDQQQVARDLDMLGLAALCRRARLRTMAAASAADMAVPTGRTLFLGGREESVLDSLDRGIVAYLVSDRRLHDHRQLPLAEADRVVAEAMRLAVPRPMSDEGRKGCLSVMPTPAPSEVRTLGASLLIEDSRADWMVLGPHLIVYTEGAEVAARLVREGAERIAPSVNVKTIGLLPVEAARPSGRLPETSRWRLCLSEPDAIHWARLRRSRIEDVQSRTPVPPRGLPSLAQVRAGDARAGSYAITDLRSAAPFPALLPQARSFAGRSSASAALPFEDESSENIIAFVEEDDPSASEEKGGGRASALVRALRARGAQDAMLVCIGTKGGVLENLLWEQEENRLRAIVTVPSNEGNGDVRRSKTPAPLEPLPLIAPLSATEDAAEIEAAVERIMTMLEEERP